MLTIAAETDAVGAAHIIHQITALQNVLLSAGYHLGEVRVPQKGYDALATSSEAHKGPALAPGLVGPVPKWIQCLNGIPVRPIEDTKPPNSGRKDREMELGTATEQIRRGESGNPTPLKTVANRLAELDGTLNSTASHMEAIAEKVGCAPLPPAAPIAATEIGDGAVAADDTVISAVASLQRVAERVLQQAAAVREILF